MFNQVILEGQLSVQNKEGVNTETKQTTTKSGDLLYYQRFATISVARGSGENSNWDNIPVIVKSKNKSDLEALTKLQGKRVKCKGGIRTSYNEKTKTGYTNVVTGSIAEVTAEEVEMRKAEAQKSMEPTF